PLAVAAGALAVAAEEVRGGGVAAADEGRGRRVAGDVHAGELVRRRRHAVGEEPQEVPGHDVVRPADLDPRAACLQARDPRAVEARDEAGDGQSSDGVTGAPDDEAARPLGGGAALEADADLRVVARS